MVIQSIHTAAESYKDSIGSLQYSYGKDENGLTTLIYEDDRGPGDRASLFYGYFVDGISAWIPRITIYDHKLGYRLIAKVSTLLKNTSSSEEKESSEERKLEQKKRETVEWLIDSDGEIYFRNFKGVYSQLKKEDKESAFAKGKLKCPDDVADYNLAYAKLVLGEEIAKELNLNVNDSNGKNLVQQFEQQQLAAEESLVDEDSAHSDVDSVYSDAYSVDSDSDADSEDSSASRAQVTRKPNSKARRFTKINSPNTGLDTDSDFDNDKPSKRAKAKRAKAQQDMNQDLIVYFDKPDDTQYHQKDCKGDATSKAIRKINDLKYRNYLIAPLVVTACVFAVLGALPCNFLPIINLSARLMMLMYVCQVALAVASIGLSSYAVYCTFGSALAVSKIRDQRKKENATSTNTHGETERGKDLKDKGKAKAILFFTISSILTLGTTVGAIKLCFNFLTKHGIDNQKGVISIMSCLSVIFLGGAAVLTTFFGAIFIYESFKAIKEAKIGDPIGDIEALNETERRDGGSIDHNDNEGKREVETNIEASIDGPSSSMLKAKDSSNSAATQALC